MASIQLDGHEIKKGNFQLFSEVLDNGTLGELLFEMERNYLTNRKAFAANLREVYEALFTIEYLRLYPCDEDKLEDIMKNDMASRKYENQFSAKLNSAGKIFLVLQCCQQAYVPLFKKSVEYFKVWAGKNAKWLLKGISSEEGIKNIIIQLYAFACDSHHVEHKAIYEPNEENCYIFYHVFYYFLRAYCQIYGSDAEKIQHAKPEMEAVPLNHYVPLSGGDVKLMGLKKPKGKRFYVAEQDNKIKYFLVCDVDKSSEVKREIEVLRDIWADDNYLEPSNIIRFKEELVISQDKSKMVFSLPSKPAALSAPVLEQMALNEKVMIFKDAQRAIASLHSNVPAFYHRDINPEVFTVCSIRNGYKMFLNAFECVKNTDENAVLTVRTIVKNNRMVERKKAYIAPEIMELESQTEEWLKADWKKADIYSLGMLGVFIFTGGTDPEKLETVDGMDTALKEKIRKMCAPMEQRVSEL